MITMYRKKQVLNYHVVYGYGAKKIRRVLEQEGKEPMALNTIKKYVRKYEGILATQGPLAAAEYYNSEDKFNTPERSRTVLDAKACQFIEHWLEINRQRKACGEQKQCIDMQEVWRQLTEEQGYTMSYATVTAYAREYTARQNAAKESKAKECFIRQYHPAGEECQFDWGDVKLKIGGRKMVLRMAAFVLPHSNHKRGYLFIREDTLAFQESHRNYFHDIQRIPHGMVYDNMKVAVKSFAGTQKEPTVALLDMSTFYGFGFRFCNARRGNEKGNVEETVKVLRKAAFTVRTEFDTIEEAQEYLDSVCERLNRTEQSYATKDIIQLVQEDFTAMMPWKDDFACFRLEERQVNNYGVITVDKSYYSVPDRLAQSSVTIRNYTNKVEVIDGNAVVATHEKVPAGVWRIKLEHYLHTLSYKPGALKNAEALRQAPEGLQRLFRECFIDKPKDFIELLKYARQESKTYDDLITAYRSLKEKNVRCFSLEILKSALSSEKCEESVNNVKALQDPDGIEENACKGMAQLAELMNKQLKTTRDYAAAI